MEKKRIWLISDTHGQEDTLIVPKDIDIVIHAGDESNNKSPIINEGECTKFLNWYSNLDIEEKIFVAGNHSSAIEKKYITRGYIKSLGITYLEHEGIDIDGLKIWGSPYTKSFGSGWAFNVRPDRLHDYWLKIPEELDILVTHGPPKYILDVSIDENDKLEYCGDLALYKAVLSRKIKYHQFGHLHNCKGVLNAGTKTIANCDTVFINTSCVTDGKFGEGCSSNGQIIEI